MKPQVGGRREADVVAKQQAVPQGDTRATSLEPLGEVEKRVVDCLRSAVTGLTARQLEARVDDTSADVDEILAGLLARKLVRRLNTLIPTYTLRDASGKVDAE